ncbi:hypothetical protein A8E81_02675 [Burkholderia cenocepacia]|nr:hypothetical protein A8E75_14110 [Burkholderia cenocepacia]ONV20793.1 hypothetical protein A8E77_34620 [Burkholderia cenocepacia]ONV33380.1 hypothetical protein A8E78_12375 [Burkholderia cenocepacia]ONV57221.1 hypothetical protein A8E81_06775 [Burkholderia cenocepacia]ONV58196.1 hypothetical protein A8E79_21895 [Burkholderia cenocepacia]
MDSSFKWVRQVPAVCQETGHSIKHRRAPRGFRAATPFDSSCGSNHMSVRSGAGDQANASACA